MKIIFSANLARETVTKLERARDSKKFATAYQRMLEIQRRKEVAIRDTLPSVLRKIQHQIKAASAGLQKSLNFPFVPWMEGELLHAEVAGALRGAGYKVSVESYTPTEGGDPESGEGASISGPTEYSLRIGW